jgi:hypothetical protein
VSAAVTGAYYTVSGVIADGMCGNEFSVL